MRVVTSGEMLTIEEQAEALFGLGTQLLMERAGQAVAEEAERMLPDSGNVLIACGKGNNGGDGFVAARLLSSLGYNVTVFSLAEKDAFPPAAKAAFEKVPQGVAVIGDFDLAKLDAAIIESDLIIDAIFGFSLRGAVRGLAVDVIDRINRSQKPVLAVDMPSGLEADTGKVYGRGVEANITVTFTAPKVGMLLYPGSLYTGEFIIADIGIPDELVRQHAGFRYLERADAYDLLPPRKLDAHKRSVGHVLVVGGSYGMSGAAVLTAHAAYKMGAGLVTFASPRSITEVLNGSLTEAIVRPQPETESGTLALAAYDSIAALALDADVVAIGPGLTTEGETVELVRMLVRDIETPLVIDADGLNALVEATGMLTERSAPAVITPHPGEMARLFGVGTKDVLDDWIGFAHRARDEFGAVTVLKGPRTVISGKYESTINLTGNPGLATAGTGDVLTGFIAALIGQGLDTYNAASLAAHLHGLSADIASEDMSEYSLMAGDVIDYLPEAISWIL